jgi:hypothetical protein
MISQANFSRFFRTSKRDGYDTDYLVNFFYNTHSVQLFLMEFEGRIPTQKERIVQFDDGDKNGTYIGD